MQLLLSQHLKLKQKLKPLLQLHLRNNLHAAVQPFQ
jgi:hypothetical protein